VENFESARTTIRALGAMARTVVNASARNRAAPRTSAARPLRIRIATTTGRAIGVQAVAISGCNVFLPVNRPTAAPCLA
jgi:hypothetical protein